MASSLTSWAINTVFATAMEFFVICGIFVLFGFLLYWLEKRTFSVSPTPAATPPARGDPVTPQSMLRHGRYRGMVNWSRKLPDTRYHI